MFLNISSESGSRQDDFKRFDPRGPFQPNAESNPDEDRKLEELKSKLHSGQIKINKKVSSLHNVLPSSPEVNLIPKKF